MPLSLHTRMSYSPVYLFLFHEMSHSACLLMVVGVVDFIQGATLQETKSRNSFLPPAHFGSQSSTLPLSQSSSVLLMVHWRQQPKWTSKVGGTLSLVSSPELVSPLLWTPCPHCLQPGLTLCISELYSSCSCPNNFPAQGGRRVDIPLQVIYEGPQIIVPCHNCCDSDKWTVKVTFAECHDG